MQHQHDVSDCGLIVAAVCIALVTSQSSHMKWDPLMRSHLSKCLVHHHICSIFPTLNTGIESSLTCGTERNYTLYLCLIMPED